MNKINIIRRGLMAVSLAILAHHPQAHANSAIALNERNGSYCWVASGARLLDLEVTAKHWLYRDCNVLPDQFPRSAGCGWGAVAINHRKKKFGYAFGWGSESTARRLALERAGGEKAGAKLEFVVNEQGNRQLHAFKCHLWR